MDAVRSAVSADAELVAFRVSHRNVMTRVLQPCPRPGLGQLGDLRGDRGPPIFRAEAGGHPYVDVQPVLGHLGLGHPQDRQRRADAGRVTQPRTVLRAGVWLTQGGQPLLDAGVRRRRRVVLVSSATFQNSASLTASTQSSVRPIRTFIVPPDDGDISDTSDRPPEDPRGRQGHGLRCQADTLRAAVDTITPMRAASTLIPLRDPGPLRRRAHRRRYARLSAPGSRRSL
jgi:hypothetical protein